MSTANTPPVVLIIAGNDPSGGAGICADTQAGTALGCHPAPVLSSLTVQDTVNAYEVRFLDPDFVSRQAETVLADLDVRAIKLGLLGNADTGMAIAKLLAKYPDIPVVTDPVLIAAGGAQLAEAHLVDVYLEEILPRTTIFTPNAHEFRRLAPEYGSAGERAARLLASGCQYLLHKGGDEDTPDVINMLYSQEGAPQEFRWERFPGSHHGSGCTLASAIAAYLARGEEPENAVRKAQAFTHQAIATGWKLGKGQNIPNRHSV